jgi:WD repeat-containing protein 48
VNFGKWVLRNIFLGFIREEQRSRRKREPNSVPSPTGPRKDTLLSHVDLNGKQPKKRSSSSSDISKRSTRLHNTMVISSPKMIPAVSPTVSPPSGPSPLLTTMLTLHPFRKDNMTTLSPVIQSPNVPPTKSDNTSTPRPRLQVTDIGQPSVNLIAPTTSKDGDYFSMQPRQATTQGGAPAASDDVSSSKNDTNVTPNAPTPGGGLMGRLKNLGKISSSKKPAESGPSSLPPGEVSSPDVPSIPEVKHISIGVCH